VEGDWEATDDPDQLIKSEWVFRARSVPHEVGDRKLGVDVARFGDDKTVFAMSWGNGLEFTREYPDVPINRIVDLVKGYLSEPEVPLKPEDVRVDAVGLGAGVVDLLVAEGYKVEELIGGAKPIPRPGQVFKFANLRSQMWWEFREKLRLGIFSLPADLDPKLMGDLIAPRYEIKADRTIQVESKSDIKHRLGRSTDYGDAVVYAVFDLPQRRAPRIAPSVSRINHRL